MNTKYFIFALSCGLAFAFGMFSEVIPSERALAQTEVQEAAPALTYDQIPCPSKTEIQQYIKNAHITGLPENPTCDGTATEKLLKIFKLASLIKADIPKGWAGYAESILRNPLEFISHATPALDLGSVTSHAIASNENGKKIYLGHELFDLPPLKALEILIHENHHSNPQDVRHTSCLTGDVFKSTGGCDALFDSSSSMGAYSVGVYFSLGYSLYGNNLSPATRQQLMNSAIAVLSTRFNNVPYTLAHPLDLLYVLTPSGGVAFVHPFTFELYPVDIELKSDEKIERIQFNPLHNGLLAFTNRGAIYSVNQWSKEVDYYKDILPAGKRFVDSNKVYTPSANYTYTYFVEDNGNIYFKDTDSSTNKDKIYIYRRDLPFLTKRFFSSLGNEMTVLSETGTFLQFASHGPASLKAQEMISTRIENVHWKDGSGGITNDVLYAVGSDGLVYFTDDSSSLQEPISTSTFTSDESIEKFQESLNLQMAMSTEGSLYIWDHEHSTAAPRKMQLPPVSDFAIGRRYMPSALLQTFESPLSAKENVCGWIKTYSDPWTQKPMGLNAQGQLIFSGATPEQPCVEIKGYSNGKKMEMGTKILSRTNTYFDRTFLHFTDDTFSYRFFPYTNTKDSH